MAGVVGVWLGEFAKVGRPEAARAAGAEAGRRHQGDDGIRVVETRQKGGVQEKRRRNSGVLAESEAVVCMLMDRFAPA
ncbi:uncharacterized protein LOC133913394 [Phragmites australis]|uniref:uncharacterized protein LOC133913394 n=1 Tax=Phragmites australis TaxID=29695 RepID=UPI002D77958B|nr:uncharacterized protein LOC133913394 [Phragmites australis]